MKKWLLIVLGVLLIALIAFFCFNSKRLDITRDLIANTKSALGDKAGAIKVGVKGSGYKTTRIVTLEGTVPSQAAKEQAQEQALNAKGVAGVENLLVVKEPKQEIKQPKPAAAPIPSPYTIGATKDKNGTVVLNGYVLNAQMHQKLLADAKALFGENSVKDNLKEAKGAPSGWFETSKLGLGKLKDVEFGEFEISDSIFKFKGYVSTQERKDELINSLNSQLSSAYKGSFELEAPKAEVIEIAENNSSQAEQNTTKANETENEVISCETRVNSLLAREKIHFEYNKAVIKPESYDLLANVVEIINNCPDTIVIIEGYTDSDGSDKYNQNLSQQRADAVKEYLINKGVAKERLKAIGYGEAKPVASNKTKEGRSKNRRIEFKFEGVKK